MQLKARIPTPMKMIYQNTSTAPSAQQNTASDPLQEKWKSWSTLEESFQKPVNFLEEMNFAEPFIWGYLFRHSQQIKKKEKPAIGRYSE